MELPDSKSWILLGHGTHSVVWRTRKTQTRRLNSDASADLTQDAASLNPVDELSQWIAIKVVHVNRSIPPHDIVREAAILQAISHPNIISLLEFIHDGPESPFALYMPLIPLSLITILSSPLFSPFPVTGPYSALSRPIFASYEGPGATPYNAVVKSLVYQLVLAIAYLHSLDPPIAHRDINPGNVLIDHEGTVKLVDFGIAWTARHVQEIPSHGVVSESSQSHPFDAWTETPEMMCCEVATGPHRAPELLFSPRSYSATATDLWSLGTTIAQFFTSLRLVPSYSPDSSPGSVASDETESQLTRPFLIPSSLMSKTDYKATWERVSLFDGERGELGLAWSIFKLRGTPNEDTWPTFSSLPDANKIEFRQKARKPLHTVLPHLPPSWIPVDPIDGAFTTDATVDESPVSLIDSFLAYPPASRCLATQALNHKWFSNVLLPQSHTGSVFKHINSVQPLNAKHIYRWEGRTLSEWLHPVIRRETVKLTRSDCRRVN